MTFGTTYVSFDCSAFHFFLHYVFRCHYHSASATHSFLYHRSYIFSATKSVLNIDETLAFDWWLQFPSVPKPRFEKHLRNVPDFNLRRLGLYCKQGSPTQQNNVCTYAAQYKVITQHMRLRKATCSCNTTLAPTQRNLTQLRGLCLRRATQHRHTSSAAAYGNRTLLNDTEFSRNSLVHTALPGCW